MSSDARARALAIVNGRVAALDGTDGTIHIDPKDLARRVYPDSRSSTRGPRSPEPRHIHLMSAVLLDWSRAPPAGVEVQEVEAYDRVILRVRRVRT
jgi:hypothetical protein